MTTSRSQKIEALRARLAALQAAEQAAAARARAAASKSARANDARRKILVGAFVLEGLGLGGVARLSVDGRHFPDWLRPADRALFDLPPLPPPATAPPPGSAMSAAGAASHDGGSEA